MNQAEVELSENFENAFNAMATRYDKDDEIIKILNFIKGIFVKSRLKENEIDACKLLIRKCEEVCNDKTKPNKKIFTPLNNLGQFVIRIRKKTKEAIIQERRNSNSSSSSSNNNEANSSKNTNNVIEVTSIQNDGDAEKIEEQQKPIQNEIENTLSEKDLKVLNKMKDLDKKLLDLNKKIHEFENKEIDFDASDFEEKQEAFYEQESRLKKAWLKGKMCLERLMKKYPHLVEPDAKFEKLIERIPFKHTRYQEINLEIEKNLNKKNSHKIFPDYADVQSWVSKVNTEANLNLSPRQIEEISTDSFKEIGRLLKLRRNHENELIQKSRLKDIKNFGKKLEGKTSESDSGSNLTEEDPAEKNKELAEKLEANVKKAKEEEKKVFEKFCRLQEENGDKTDSEEIDDDDEEEESRSSKLENEESIDESFCSQDLVLDNQSTSDTEDKDEFEQAEEENRKEATANPPSLKENATISSINQSVNSVETCETPSFSLSQINQIQDNSICEKTIKKRQIDSIQETVNSEKENSASDSSSEPYNCKRSKLEQKSTKRNITQSNSLDEHENRKEENNTVGLYTKQMQNIKLSLNESSPKNNKDSNITKVKSISADDCIILD